MMVGQNETEADVRVIRLPTKRSGEAAGLLARCCVVPRMFAAGLLDALNFGHAYGAPKTYVPQAKSTARAERGER